jgi:hypothetical protein
VSERDNAVAALTTKIKELAEKDAQANALAILRLAEARAWLQAPAQPHGGSAQEQAK